MGEYRIIYSKTGLKTGLIVGLTGILFVILLGSVMLSTGAPFLITLIVFIVGLPLALILAFGAIWLGKKIERTFESLKSMIFTITDEGITFNRPVNYMVGFIETAGYWYSTGRSRSYRSVANFLVLNKGSSDRIDLKDIVGYGYTIMSDNIGNGFMLLPMITLDEPEFKNVKIVLIPRIEEFVENEVELNVYHKAGDMGNARIRIDKDKMIGVLNYMRKNKSRSLRLELEGEIPDAPLVGRLTRRIKIMTLKNPGTININYPLNPEQPIAIIMWGRVNPNKIIQALKNVGVKLGKEIIYGYSKGKYRVKLVLDIPLQKDVVASRELVLRSTNMKEF